MSRFRSRSALRRTVVVGALGVGLTVGAEAASATPPAGIVGGPVLSRGTATENALIGSPVTRTVTRKVRVRVRGRTITKRVRIRVRSAETLIACTVVTPCDMAFQQVTIAPGGHTGWHTHPGTTFVAVAEGEGTLYHGGAAGTACASHRYLPGGGFFQSFKDVHTLWNHGTTNLVVHALYVLPPGTPNTALRTDQPQQASCPAIP
jgi:quercetin dioxygenase-like cupin family protein